MPRAPRGPGSGQPRPHSRSSSATRLGANLQFTQKESQPPKLADKTKKAPYVHEPHPTKTAPPFATQRAHSREHLPKRLAPLHHHHQQPQPRPKNPKGGFTIASPSENADDDDDDDEDWVSSESGAATPNQQDSDSETASEEDDPTPALLNLQIPPAQPQARAPPPPTHQVGFLAKNGSSLARVDTARPSDFEHPPRIERNTPRPRTPPKQYHQPQVQPPPPPPQPMMERRPTPSEPENLREPPIHAQQQSPRPKRSSRPPSTHSMQSRSEYPLRPHPLIRGMSHGHVIPVPKPSPLAPLTVLPVEADLPQVSSSPSSVHDSVRNYLSSSPTSIKTSSGSPVSADLSHSARYPPSQDRRTSFSSARSVNTIPVQTTIIRETPWMHDRTRTLSTMSSSSLSAALSSLTHIPSVTRPPSPQSIVFFPPLNPHANVEAIHPLLPVPYLQNHLTVLSRRTPIRESFDRVMHAKNTR
ncbi:hypothetical protein M413DRAFT_8436 [Hebeloma cylindrosporum]|uniref:Uncharacterized protein n=1 Tax=Hebeloma cylindrosporum TaxID=76867 RepID=A0A0C3C8I6_HEBCY|nr:hypothetical protein M413DRAFT_8436 [Hebeloma cylindrosporum h7]